MAAQPPPQQLPIPVALEPGDRYQPPMWRHSWRRSRWPMLMVGAGLAAALAGGALSVIPGSATVRLDGRGYQLGSLHLASAGPGSYSSQQASLVINSAGPATVAGLSSRVRGEPMTGRCVLEAARSKEQCTFVIGSRTSSSVDVRTSSGWHRRYSDGRQVEIRTEGSDAIPVPFPVGT